MAWNENLVITVVIGCQDQIRPTMSDPLAVSAFFCLPKRLLVPVS